MNANIAYVQSKISGENSRIGKLINIAGDMLTIEFEPDGMFNSETITIPASFFQFVSKREYEEQRMQIKKDIMAMRKLEEANRKGPFACLFEGL